MCSFLFIARLVPLQGQSKVVNDFEASSFTQKCPIKQRPVDVMHATQINEAIFIHTSLQTVQTRYSALQDETDQFQKLISIKHAFFVFPLGLT